MAAVLGTATAAQRAAPPTVDQRLTVVLARSRGSAFDRAVGAFTDIGSVFGLVGVSGTLVAAGRSRLGVRTAVAGSAAWVVAQVVKDMVDRRRPYELGVAELLVSVPHGSSWPSGHSAVAAAMADTIATELRPAGKVGAWLVAAGVAASRLHVGAHHATDTVAGAAVGMLAAEGGRLVLDALTGERQRSVPDA